MCVCVCVGGIQWGVYPDSKVHGANMGPTWVLSAPDRPHICPMNIAIRVINQSKQCVNITTPSHDKSRRIFTNQNIDIDHNNDISAKYISKHYIDVIMTTMASQITSLTVVYSIVYSGADQRKHQSSASLAFVREIHRDRWIPRTKGQ